MDNTPNSQSFQFDPQMFNPNSAPNPQPQQQPAMQGSLDEMTMRQNMNFQDPIWMQFEQTPAQNVSNVPTFEPALEPSVWTSVEEQQPKVSDYFSSKKEEKKPVEKKNPLWKISFFFAILGLVFLITFIGIPLGVAFAWLWVVFWIFWLLKSPRWKAFIGLLLSSISLFSLYFRGTTLKTTYHETEHFFQELGDIVPDLEKIENDGADTQELLLTLKDNLLTQFSDFVFPSDAFSDEWKTTLFNDVYTRVIQWMKSTVDHYSLTPWNEKVKDAISEIDLEKEENDPEIDTKEVWSDDVSDEDNNEDNAESVSDESIDSETSDDSKKDDDSLTDDSEDAMEKEEKVSEEIVDEKNPDPSQNDDNQNTESEHSAAENDNGIENDIDEVVDDEEIDGVIPSNIPDCAKNFQGRLVNGLEESDTLIDGETLYYNNDFWFCVTLGKLWDHAKIKTTKQRIKLIKLKAQDNDPESDKWWVYSYAIEDFNWKDNVSKDDPREEVGKNNKYAISLKKPSELTWDSFYYIFNPDIDSEDSVDASEEWYQKADQWFDLHKKEYEPDIVFYDVAE